MSYTVLARKWRPRNFAEMAGQEHVLRALINALDNDRLHHGFLFTGTRGVGKTTIARILAKCINCDKGVSSTPCGECSTCQEIDDGRFVDLIEVDAASRTKVDDTRELLDNVQYAPTSGRYKVYLIDEVHMLSRHSFNALLKTLEEPPPHVKFLLATTDPQRLPATVLSRCLQFNLKRLPKDLIAERMNAICEAESFECDATALDLLAHGADGSMRDALSLLDQAVAYGSGAVKEGDVRAMLGTVDRNKVYELARTLAQKDGKAVLEQVASMDEYAPDYSEVLQELALLLQRAAILHMTEVKPRDSQEMADLVVELCKQLDSEEIQLLYQIAIVGRRDLPLAPDVRSGFEMVLLRMLAFLPAAPGSGEPAKKKRLNKEAAVGAGSAAKNSEADSAPSAAPWETEASANTGVNSTTSDAERSVKTSAQVDSRQSPTTSGAGSVSVTPESSPSSAKNTPTLGASGSSGKRNTSATDAELDFTNWSSVIELLSLHGAARQLAVNCVVTDYSSRHLRLLLDESNQHMMTQQVLQKFIAVVQNHLGDGFSINIDVGTVEADTPAVQQQESEKANQQAIRDSLLNDPNVKVLLETFDATIHEGSIKPIN
ncbi:MAG: DNA polymerase III subunit gamma/tau [Gammaproteobacteria bacterium]